MFTLIAQRKTKAWQRRIIWISITNANRNGKKFLRKRNLFINGSSPRKLSFAINAKILYSILGFSTTFVYLALSSCQVFTVPVFNRESYWYHPVLRSIGKSRFNAQLCLIYNDISKRDEDSLAGRRKHESSC